MFKRISRSLIKKILPLIFKILLKFKLNRRVINFLNEKSYFSNNNYDFSSIIKSIIKDEKIIALDVGAQGGFNSDNFFSKKYHCFFDDILVDPIKTDSDKLEEKRQIINKGLWSNKEKKRLFVLDNRPGSSSMYSPEKDNFDLHNIKKKDYSNYDITREYEVQCDTLDNLLQEINIKNLDYLKIDTQGAELEILKGMSNYNPLLIRLEVHIFSMYKDVPSWHELLNYLYKMNYVLIDWKGIGSHNTRIPAEMDMIFIPNFTNDEGKKAILNSKSKFLSLMLIFGQLNLLKIIMRKFNIHNQEIEKFEDLYFN